MRVEHVSDTPRSHTRSGRCRVCQRFHCLYGRFFLSTGLARNGRRDCPGLVAYGIPEFAVSEKHQRHQNRRA